MAQQRMQQQIASGVSAGALGMADANVKGTNPVGGTLGSDSQVHQGCPQTGVSGSHDGRNSQRHEPDRSISMNGGNIHGGHGQPLQSSSSMVENSQGPSRRTGGLGLVAFAASAFEASKNIMETLRRKHTNLASELEVLLTKIGQRFVTLPEERLLAVVNALFHRCYKYPTTTMDEVPQSHKKELSEVCQACFSPDVVNKHVNFIKEYKHEFECDLDQESATTFPGTLSELTERLKHWKNVLQTNVVAHETCGSEDRSKLADGNSFGLRRSFLDSNHHSTASWFGKGSKELLVECNPCTSRSLPH